MVSRTIYAADLFAGAGGTSTGLVQACAAMGLGLELVAINHWETAVETHAANHPEANHLCASLDGLDPSKVIPRRKLDLLVASPECTHHSSARGGRPMDDQSRASAWHVLHWAERLRVENIVVENVRDFLTWGPLGANGRPLKKRSGETFRAFIAALRSLGYSVDWRVLNCADYGDATTRRRLFIFARRGHPSAQPRWPEPSHGVHEADLFARARDLPAWRPAREIIDWTLRGDSIFDRKKPLAEKTLARIAEGLRRFGGDAAEPFLCLLRGTSPTHLRSSARSLDLPAPALTGGGTHLGLVEPFTLSQQSGGAPRRVSRPLQTVAGKGAVSLIEPFIVPRYGERPTQAPRVHGVAEPMPTVPGTCQHHLCEPFLVTYNRNGGPRSVDQPVPTLTTRDRLGMVEAGTLDIRFRMLQPHELAAAMSFPDGYRFTGTKTDVVKQIGNAVPVRTARALIENALQRRA